MCVLHIFYTLQYGREGDHHLTRAFPGAEVARPSTRQKGVVCSLSQLGEEGDVEKRGRHGPFHKSKNKPRGIVFGRAAIQWGKAAFQ